MTDIKILDTQVDKIAWCPGCGDFSILKSLKIAISELGITPQELVMVSGIGQAAKTPQYINSNMFNGLHGRGLPAAVAIKVSNPKLKVVMVSGDGCSYGEGGNHFIHNIRRNPGVTHIVNNNMVYGLTKGQASPTSQIGFHTPVQTDGVFEEPFNPLALAITLGATFVARAFAADIDKTKEIIKAAITHNGYALIDILQPCVSFNKVNTFAWFKDNSYYLPNDYKPNDKIEALKKVLISDKFALGVIYKRDGVKTFEENVYANNSISEPIVFNKNNPIEKTKEMLLSLI